jgi:hypothetical protein
MLGAGKSAKAVQILLLPFAAPVIRLLLELDFSAGDGIGQAFVHRPVGGKVIIATLIALVNGNRPRAREMISTMGVNKRFLGEAFCLINSFSGTTGEHTLLTSIRPKAFS